MGTTILVQGREYKLVSRRDGGEYAGPCLFRGIGEDRFHIWPSKGNWYCRHECPDCPGRPVSTGGRTGWLDGRCNLSSVPVLQPQARPGMDRVLEYHRALDDEALSYLASRGIRRETAVRYILGRSGNRVTIPLVIATNGKRRCIGIKRRWIGEPPEDWIAKYTMEAGSIGLAIFNFDRLRSAKRWPYVLIVEGVLDCILLDQMRIPAVAPFGGGGVWDPSWKRFFRHVDKIVIVADRDEPDGAGNIPGLAYANKKRKMLGRGSVVFPPGGHKDIGEAVLAGENIRAWIGRLIKRREDRDVHFPAEDRL